MCLFFPGEGGVGADTLQMSYDISAGKGHTFKYMFDNAGTIRSSQKFLVKHQRRQLVSLLGETSDPEERRQIQQSIINCGSEETLFST